MIAQKDVYLKQAENLNQPNAPWYPLFDMNASEQGIILLRLDKIIAGAGITTSVSEAGRKLKERAVRIDGNIVVASQVATRIPVEFKLNVGRHWKKVRII